MKTISMPIEEYEKELQKAREEGREELRGPFLNTIYSNLVSPGEAFMFDPKLTAELISKSLPDRSVIRPEHIQAAWVKLIGVRP
jgi:hypothetical protein